MTNLVGVAIVLTAVQLYRDVTPALQAPDSFLDNDFIILTKEVEGAGIGKTSFTQTGAGRTCGAALHGGAGRVYAGTLRVMGGFRWRGSACGPTCFSRAYPTVSSMSGSDEWGFEEGSEFVPIILPRNYLNLYNFGFASTRGLPQVSEDLVRGITLDLDLSGRGQFRNLKGRVVAFSNRLNTTSFRRSSSAGRTVGSPINLRPILRGSFWRCGTLRTTGSMNTLRSTATRSKEVPATKAGRATFCAWRREWWSAWGC